MDPLGLYGTWFVQDEEPFYDGRELTWYEILIAPLMRDMHILIPAFIMWFVVQFGSEAILNKTLPSFRKLSKKEKQQFCIRICAVLNGMIATPGAIQFIVAPKNGLHYNIIRGPYEWGRTLIITYFAWDIVVCYAYNWDWAWKLHAWCSFFGTCFLNFPISDGYQCSFSGLFEMSNAFIHIAEMLSALDSTREEKDRIHGKLSHMLKCLFAFLFLVIRIIVGTWITLVWTFEMINLMASGKCHSNFTITACLVMLIPMMFLQYYWFYLIFRTGMGWDVEVEDKQKVEEKKEQ